MPTHDLMQRVAAGPTTFLVRRADALLYGAVVLVLVAPFFVFDTIPLYDLPDHIARQHLLFGNAAPGMESYYEARWRLIPNLALEGTVFLLHYVLSIDLCIRIFLALTVGQLFLGTLALHHALFGRCGRLPLAAALFAYTGPLLFGFVNFCFGSGLGALAVCAVAALARANGCDPNSRPAGRRCAAGASHRLLHLCAPGRDLLGRHCGVATAPRRALAASAGRLGPGASPPGGAGRALSRRHAA